MFLLSPDRFCALLIYICFCALAEANHVIWTLPNGFPVGSRAIIAAKFSDNVANETLVVDFFDYNPSEIKNGDIALRVSIQSGNGLITVGSYSVDTEKWEGWSTTDSKFSIRNGEELDVMVTAELTHFSVHVNSIHAHDFKYRSSPTDLRFLQVTPNIPLKTVTVDKTPVISWHFPSGFPDNQTIKIWGLTTKRNHNKEFNINLQNCIFYGKYCNIALGMWVKYGEGLTINNSYKNARWGEPEIHENSPIKTGEKFFITVTKYPKYFEIAVNEKEFFTFKDRGLFDDIFYLMIRNTIDVIGISQIS